MLEEVGGMPIIRNNFYCGLVELFFIHDIDDLM